jgi:hypothetical protein
MKMLLLPLILLLAAPLCAQETFKPYIAKVTGESVRLRSGPSLQHPPIHVLSKDDELTVVGVKEAFAVVRLPAAAPCWIAADLVKLEGTSYTVSGENVNLRCTPDTRYFAVGQVDKGAKLAAVMDGQAGTPAAENGFVKIAPPEQATGAVSSEFIEKVRDAEAVKPVEAAKPVEAPKPAEGPKKEVSATAMEDERLGFAALEGLLFEELKKPGIETDFTGMRKLFEQFAQSALDPEVAKKAKEHIAKIDTTVKLFEEERKRLEADSAARKAALEKLRNEALHKEEPKPEQPKGPVEYLAQGTIGSTGKSAKTPASHRMFDADGKVLYDLRWDKGDLGRLMGCKVGIVGVVKEYEGWPNKVVIIERIDVISDEEGK